MFYIPNYLLDADNSVPANPLATPAHVVPEWYLLPFYAMLRAIPNKLWGVIILLAAIVVLAFIPWLDRSPVKSAKYRPSYRFFFWVFVAICIGLGYLGSQEPTEGLALIARILTFGYFAFFLIIMPILSFTEKTKPIPDLDRRRGADEDENRGGCGRVMRTGSQGSSTMIRIKFSALAFAATALVLASVSAVLAQSDADQPKPPRQSWSFSGMFGIYDKAQLQRGFQVYKEVCSTCHALSIPFRTLTDPDGPGFSEDQIRTLAATYQVTNAEPNEKGEIFKRPGTPADNIPRPEAYPNDQAAAATLGKAPPDMALLAKALKYERGFPWFIFDALPGLEYQEMGADYIHAILTGYTKPDDPQWNLYYPGHKIAMPQPITDGAVDYKDGTKPTLENYSKDVAAFLSWAAEPNLPERKRIGLRVMIFLIVFAVLLYFVKKRIWAVRALRSGRHRGRRALIAPRPLGMAPLSMERGEPCPKQSSGSSAARAFMIFPA